MSINLCIFIFWSFSVSLGYWRADKNPKDQKELVESMGWIMFIVPVALAAYVILSPIFVIYLIPRYLDSILDRQKNNNIQ